MALGQMGPAAVGAASELETHARAGSPEAAVAWWRVTDDPAPALAFLLTLDGQPRVLRCLAEFGPLAVATIDRVRSLLGAPDQWTTVEAAGTLARIDQDTQAAVAVLIDAAQPLTEGEFLPVRLAALKHLADISAPVDDIAHAILNRPQRFRYAGSWRGFETDEAVCDAARAILASRSPG